MGAVGPTGNRRVNPARAVMRQGVAPLLMRLERISPRLRAYLSRGLTVFLYHEITDSPSEFQRVSDGFTTPRELERQLRWIRDRFSIIAPTDLPQLGGVATLPENAALITFDDAWAGVFRAGVEILESLAIPALCFVNMATVAGAPDLAAVRRYERLRREDHVSRLDQRLDPDAAASLIGQIEEIYGSDPEFLGFQGPTASEEDLGRTSGRHVWLGSHLFHHWDADLVEPALLAQSARANLEALSSYSATVSALATPHGRVIEWSAARAAELGASVLFVVTGAQNPSATASVLDRMKLEPSGPSDWWWSVHRRRLLGRFAG